MLSFIQVLYLIWGGGKPCVWLYKTHPVPGPGCAAGPGGRCFGRRRRPSCRCLPRGLGAAPSGGDSRSCSLLRGARRGQKVSATLPGKPRRTKGPGLQSTRQPVKVMNSCQLGSLLICILGKFALLISFPELGLQKL